MEIEGLARELYGLPRGDFVASRNVFVKQVRDSGDRLLADAVRALPKPTAGAALVNRIARARSDELTRVLDLGVRMRQAQQDGDGSLLRDLGADQATALDRLSRVAVEEADETVSQVVRDRFVQTIRAAMADPEAAGVVASGLLVRDLESPGFGPVDLSGALAVDADVPAYVPSESALASVGSSGSAPGPGRATKASAAKKARTKTPADPKAIKRADQRLADATASADALAADLAEATDELATTKARVAELRATEARLREELTEVLADSDEAKTRLRGIQKLHADLERKANRSRFAVRQAQAELDDLT